VDKILYIRSGSFLIGWFEDYPFIVVIAQDIEEVVSLLHSQKEIYLEAISPAPLCETFKELNDILKELKIDTSTKNPE
jgi:hypothetical protein